MKRLSLILAIVLACFFAQASFGAVPQAKKSTKSADVKGKKTAASKSNSDMPPPPPSDKSADKVIGKSPDGKLVYEGPKGGHYSINDKGDKVYLDAGKKKAVTPEKISMDKVVGKDESGKPIYEGPRGGRYTINDKGDKVYLKKKK